MVGREQKWPEIPARLAISPPGGKAIDYAAHTGEGEWCSSSTKMGRKKNQVCVIQERKKITAVVRVHKEKENELRGKNKSVAGKKSES